MMQPHTHTRLFVSQNEALDMRSRDSNLVNCQTYNCLKI